MLEDSGMGQQPGNEAGYSTTLEILELEDYSFAFALCRKTEQFGPVAIDQFWMDVSTIYGQREREATNLLPMTEYFRARCALGGTAHESGPHESYLLARLCPHVQGTVAQSILVDARRRQVKASYDYKTQELDNLEQLLIADRQLADKNPKKLTGREFQSLTGKYLGVPDFSQAEQKAYKRICEQLFSPARALVATHDGGFAEVLKVWNDLRKEIGRRGNPRGNADLAAKKKALAAISYESKVAVHRCYSCVWTDLIPHLAQKYAISPQTQAFLHFMHLDHFTESNHPDSFFHLFHGHVFALHPGVWPLMCTQTGKALMGQCLTAQTIDQKSDAYLKFLRAMCISLVEYVVPSEATESKEIPLDDIEAAEEARLTKKLGRSHNRGMREDQ